MAGVQQMIGRLREAGLILPTLLTLAALGALIGLGTWQLQRKAWKEALIARIAARAAQSPVDAARLLPTAEAHRTASVDPKDMESLEYARVRATGRFDHAGERHLTAIHPEFGPGFRIVTPLVLADGTRVLVNRGFVPFALHNPDQRRAGEITDEVTVTGIVRFAESQPRFVPDNQPARNEWYWRDWLAMVGCPAEVPAARCTDKVPLDGDVLKAMQPTLRRMRIAFIDAENVEAPGGWPRAGAARIELPNRHLEYALTWFGIALALIGVYIAFARGRLGSR